MIVTVDTAESPSKPGKLMYGEVGDYSVTNPVKQNIRKKERDNTMLTKLVKKIWNSMMPISSVMKSTTVIKTEELERLKDIERQLVQLKILNIISNVGG